MKLNFTNYNLIRLYEEVKNNKLNVEIIEKEPIDVLNKIYRFKRFKFKKK